MLKLILVGCSSAKMGFAKKRPAVKAKPDKNLKENLDILRIFPQT
jgi:hypothetical protein